MFCNCVIVFKRLPSLTMMISVNNYVGCLHSFRLHVESANANKKIKIGKSRIMIEKQCRKDNFLSSRFLRDVIEVVLQFRLKTLFSIWNCIILGIPMCKPIKHRYKNRLRNNILIFKFTNIVGILSFYFW